MKLLYVQKYTVFFRIDSDAKTRAKLMMIGHSFVRLISVPAMLSTAISVLAFSCLVCLTRLSFEEGGTYLGWIIP